jgi:hypothetical protein
MALFPDSLLDELVPADITNLILGFLSPSDFYLPGCNHFRFYSQFNDTFDQPIPRAPFRDTIWYGRLHNPDSCHGVRLLAMQRLSINGELEQHILELAFERVSLSQHCQCNSGMKKLLTYQEADDSEIKYISEHIQSDWLPWFTTLLTLDKLDFLRGGIGTVISRTLLRLVESPRFDGHTKLAVLKYISLMLSTLDTEFLGRVYALNRQDFQDLIFAAELSYTDDASLRESIMEHVAFIECNHEYSHTQP